MEGIEGISPWQSNKINFVESYLSDFSSRRRIIVQKNIVYSTR